MAEDKPKMVSVVIPTWNRSPLLKRCLEALERQTLSSGRYEVVVVDDGSTDDTSAVARGLAEHLEGWKSVQIPHAGMVAARAAGVAASSGELVVFLDDDAVPSTGWL